MGDESKSKEQLIKELNNSYQQIEKIKDSEIKLKQSLATLKENDKKYRAIFENTQTATAIFNDDHKIILVNTEFEKLSGYSKEDVEYQKEWKEFVHTDDIKKLIEINKQRRIDPKSVQRSYEFKFVDRYRNCKNISINVDKIPNTNLCVASLSDITEYKRIEAKLATERSLLRTLMDNMPNLIYVKDNESRFIACNIALAHHMGVSTPEDLIGHTDFDFYPKELAKTYYNNEQKIIWTGKPIIDQIEPSVLPNGEKRWITTTKVPLKNNNGDIVGIVGMGHDITSLKNLEQQLQQAQKMEAIGRLTGGIAHDFNNMLTIIIGYSDYMLMHYKDDNHLVSHISNIKEAGNRASTLTHQLLAFSRRQILQPKVVNLNTIILNMKKMLERLIGEDIELVIKPDSSLENAKLDIHQIEQVIMNLAVNARDAMPKGGMIIIETKNVNLDEEYVKHHIPAKPGEYVMLAISDNGIGMDKKTQEQIFEPFFTTKEMGKGTGLGLSTVYGIVKQSDGYIWVYSEPDKETTFTIYFPIVKKKEDIAKKEKALPKDLSGSETILLIEDDDILRNMISSILKISGYTIFEAQNGETALKLINKEQKQKIDLVITDVIMPGISGRDTADLIKSKIPDIKILYISGYTDDAIVGHGILDSDIPFLQKPFTFKDICKKIREVLNN